MKTGNKKYSKRKHLHTSGKNAYSSSTVKKLVWGFLEKKKTKCRSITINFPVLTQKIPHQHCLEALRPCVFLHSSQYLICGTNQDVQ